MKCHVDFLFSRLTFPLPLQRVHVTNSCLAKNSRRAIVIVSDLLEERFNILANSASARNAINFGSFGFDGGVIFDFFFFLSPDTRHLPSWSKNHVTL